MDKLEKFIIENRKDLDLYEPDQLIWSKIELPGYAKPMVFKDYFLRAAMVIVIVASSFFIYILASNNSAAGYGKQSLSNSDLSSGFAETENYYNTRVNALLNEAKPLLMSDPGLEQDLMRDFSRLDSLCADIRTDLKDNVSNQEVIEALVLNYRIKVQILEDMLSMLRDQEMNNNNNTKQNEL